MLKEFLGKEAKSIKLTDAEGKKLLELVRDVKTELEKKENAASKKLNV